MRTDSSEALRCWGKWKEASSMKRHRGGQESVGLRPWYYSLESFYGLSWREFFAGSFEHFMDFAAHVEVFPKEMQRLGVLRSACVLELG
eukprot:6668078-Pyramimonas_sp.AAC.1